MTIVYVQNIDGTPLMPTMRCGHVRILLKQRKAKVVNRNPFSYLPGSIFFDKKQGGSFILQGSNGFHNGSADYYVDVRGMKHLASKCKFIQNNKGLQFVG